MNVRAKEGSGFTIVELLIVIVVIAMLATIAVAVFSGVQQRARDTTRLSDMRAIIKALELYKTQTGSYPVASAANTIGGWEVSSINPDQFLAPLVNAGVVQRVPVDPKNDGATQFGYLYKYYLYNAGSNGCDASRGAYYVLAIGKSEASSALAGSPGFQCTGRDWSTSGAWVTGGFTN